MRGGGAAGPGGAAGQPGDGAAAGPGGRGGGAGCCWCRCWGSCGTSCGSWESVQRRVGGRCSSPSTRRLAIALVVRAGGGLCRDAGESALAAVLETAGAVCALLAALPLMRAVLELLVELMR